MGGCCVSILLTGGIGYIGSHICVELLSFKYDIVVIDNFSNSNIETVDNIKNITGKEFKFYELDLIDKYGLEKVFDENSIDVVIHLAGFKSIKESMDKPLKYYKNNIIGTLILLDVMQKYNVKNMVFSSSAAVYGEPSSVPIIEDFPVKATNPYGRTKSMIEYILKDLYISDSSWSIVILRYFNPIGAHGSGKLGDNSIEIPNNLMPYITQVASGKRDKLYIFGNDYDTHDGTGVRDYIHIVDLARGHIKAIEKTFSSSGIFTYNLGTGKGYSVLDVVTTFRRVNNVEVPYIFVDRRLGDVGKSYCDPTKAIKELGWKAEKTLEDMCRDSWNWEKNSL